MKYSASLLLAASLAQLTYASQPKSMADLPDPSVEAEKAAFVVPAGYEISLWAGEPLVRKPVQMNWDAQGRLWVVSSVTYPQIKPGDDPIDQIVVLEDTDKDGKADKSTVFASDLQIPTAVIPADGGCYVANSTEILFLKDTNGDLKADERQVVLSGFGTEDTHHLVHTFRHGPDGQMHFAQSIYIHSHIETPWGLRRLMGGGIWEFRPETRKLEIIAKGLINPWGYEFDRWGQSFATDGAGSEGINYIFPGAVFATSPGAKRIVKGLNPGQPKQCGLEIIEDSHFPDDWQGTLVTCDFRGNRVNRFQLTESGSSYISKQLPDVLASTHRGFRPIDVRTGPDGALYIADWFNPIIQHGEVDFRDPRRDRVNGRIWKLTAKDRKLSSSPDFAKAEIPALLEELKSPRRWNRLFAKRELRTREPQLALASIDEWSLALKKEDPQYWNNLLEAAWARETLNACSPALVRQLLGSPDHRIRAGALGILRHRLTEFPDADALLATAIADDHAQVRLWAVAIARDMFKPQALEVALRALDKPVDESIDFLLELTAREQADIWLPVFVNGGIKLDANPKHLVYALKATGRPEALPPLIKALGSGKLAEEDAAAVLAMVGDVASPAELSQLFPIFKSESAKTRRVGILDAFIKAGQRKATPDAAAALKDLLTALISGTPDDADLAARGALLAGLWKQEPLRARLEEIASGDNTPAALRDNAIKGLVSLGGEPTKNFLQGLASGEKAVGTRASALSGLSELSPPLAAKQAVLFLGSAKSVEEARPVLEAFLKNKQLPVLLANELKDKQVPDFVAVEGIRMASSRGLQSLIEESLRKAGGVKQMDRPLTPEEMHALVTKVQAQGNAARGEDVYRRQQLLCLSCHAIGESGGLIGPNMVSLGSSAPVDYIIESLLEPSKKVKEGYHMTMITTKAGQVVAGGIVQDGDEVVVRDAANQFHKVAKADIAQKIISPVSMMPPGLTASLREDEFVDLVKFLSELGREGDYKTQPNRYVRTWRTMGKIEQADNDHVRHVGLQALSDRKYAYPWQMTLSKVNGDLPLNELPIAAKMYPIFPRIAQFDLQLDADGPVTLGLPATPGLVLVVDDQKFEEVTPQMKLDLKAGKHVVTVLVPKSAGDVSALRVELLEGAAKVVTTLQ